jgi:ATP-dependent DNA ligase
VIDREIIAYDAEGRFSFKGLQKHMSEGPALHFYAFDLLTLQGKDLTQEPL